MSNFPSARTWVPRSAGGSPAGTTGGSPVVGLTHESRHARSRCETLRPCVHSLPSLSSSRCRSPLRSCLSSLTATCSENEVRSSIARWTGAAVARQGEAKSAGSLLRTTAAASPRTGVVYRRNRELLGPMSAFGYDYFIDKYGADAAKIRLASFNAARGNGNE